MRRAIAISLLMLFSWTLIAPLVAVDAERESARLLPRKGQMPLPDVQKRAPRPPTEGACRRRRKVPLLSGQRLHGLLLQLTSRKPPAHSSPRAVFSSVHRAADRDSFQNHVFSAAIPSAAHPLLLPEASRASRMGLAFLILF